MTRNHEQKCGSSPRDYFTGQLLTIIGTGLFALVGLMMYWNGQLGYVLARQFHLPVLIGGFALLVLASIRAMSVVHDILHTEFHSETDSHGHDLVWECSRLLVLGFPVGLFLIGVPNSGFSQDRIRMLLGGDDALTGNIAGVARLNGTIMNFNALHDAANDAGKRELMQGQEAILEGRIRQIDARQFTLFRLRMTCCASDIIPVKVRVVLKSGNLNGFDDFDWVRMKGQIQFVPAPSSERYLPVIVVEDIQGIRKIEPKNEYE